MTLLLTAIMQLCMDVLLYVGHTKHYHLRYGGSVAAPDGLKDPTSAKLIEKITVAL